MEISNPIALQYVTNQGLASQLNTQNKQLPVKSDRFSVDNKIPAPTEDEQRLRSEADKKNQLPANINENNSLDKPGNEQDNNPAASQNQFLNTSQSLFPVTSAASGNLAENSNNFQQGIQQKAAGENPAVLTKEKEQASAPIQSYLETSALNSEPSNLARIDYFI